MNNSMMEELNSPGMESDQSSLLERRGELVRIVEALRRVADSKDWEVLTELVFNGVVETLERQLKNEAQNSTIVTAELYRLQGQLVWARKYADLDKLAEFFKKQIEGIQTKLKT